MPYTIQAHFLSETEETALVKYPVVKISGFNIDDVGISFNGRLITEPKYIIYTGNKSAKMDLSVTLKTDQKEPSSVRLQFRKDDGTQVFSTLTKDSTSQVWKGSVDFTISGTYKLENIIMDGEYTELEQKHQHELELYLGISVEVKDVNNVRDFTYEGNSITVPVEVEIYDNTGGEIKYLNNATLIYSKGMSAVDGMKPMLRWNSSDDCYKADLQIHDVGTYVFGCVKIGENDLYDTISTPPVYRCISPEPPSYEDAAPMADMDYLLDDGKQEYKVGVRIKNAASASARIKLFNKETGNDHSVGFVEAKRTEGGISTFEFLLPKNENGYQVGDWEIIGLEVANVYDSNSVLRTETNPLEIDINENDDVEVKVVSAKVTVIGENENIAGKEFLESATTTKDLSVKITDHLGNDLNTEYIEIAEVPEIIYRYVEGSYSTYGNYTVSGDTLRVEDKTITGSFDASEKTYKMGKITMEYAGEYYAYELTAAVKMKNSNVTNTLSYASAKRKQIEGDRFNGTVLEGLPIYTLSTESPTVMITDITLDDIEPYSVDLFDTGSMVDDIDRENYYVTDETVKVGCTTTNIVEYNMTTNENHIFATNNSEYISKMYMEIKNRPKYIIKDKIDE